MNRFNPRQSPVAMMGAMILMIFATVALFLPILSQESIAVPAVRTPAAADDGKCLGAAERLANFTLTESYGYGFVVSLIQANAPTAQSPNGSFTFGFADSDTNLTPDAALPKYTLKYTYAAKQGSCTLTSFQIQNP